MIGLHTLTGNNGDGSGSPNREPLGYAQAITEVVRAIVPVLILFNVLHWSEAQTAGVYLAVSTIASILSGIYVRNRVTPINSPVLPVGTQVSVIGGNAGDTTTITGTDTVQVDKTGK